MIFRLMVVDDEYLVTDWISHLLTEVYGSDIEVYRFNNATQALKQLMTGIYDIAILDISMPETTGIEIFTALTDKQIETQIIFLTAYGEFEYAKRAISPQVVAYILKGEPDRLLLEAVDQAMKRITEKVETDNLIKIAKKRIQVSSTNIRREYIIHILQGVGETTQNTPPISLMISPDKPVIILICALSISEEQQELNGELLLEVSSHIEDYLNRSFFYEGAMLQNNNFIWLLQHHDNQLDNAYTELLSVIESAEMLFNRHTGQDLMFVYTRNPFPFNEIGHVYQQLLPILRYGYGKGHIVLTEEDLPEIIAEEMTEESEYHQLSKDIMSLQNLIENGEREESWNLLQQLLVSFDRKHHSNDPVLLEAFSLLSGMYLAILNKHNLFSAVSKAIPLVWLGNPYAFSSWDEAASSFITLTDHLLSIYTRKRGSRSQACIEKAKDYIKQNLDQDLSLLLLAEKVFLNPSYFSILFKKKTGCNASDFIKAERLKKAKQMLTDSRLKINEIARQVGYPNATYFGKFIKQETGLTPLEYRDRYAEREQ